MDKLNKWWLEARIELHWAYIMRCRKRGNKLLERGERLNSSRMLKLARRIDHHSVIVFRLQDLFEARYVLPDQSDNDSFVLYESGVRRE